MKATSYYRNTVEIKRPYLTDSICEYVIAHAERTATEVLPSGERRIRHWAYIPELGKYVRVITLVDGETVHNAFPDRSYKP